MTDIDRYLTDELIAKAADVIDTCRHEYRVDTDTWVPYCICGWSAEEPYDMAAFDRHIAELVLEAVAPLIAARAWDEGFAAARAVLDRACMEQDDAESAMTYAAEIDDGLMLASQQARKQAWADAARAITTALGANHD